MGRMEISRTALLCCFAAWLAGYLAGCAPRPLTWQSARNEATRQVYDECGPRIFCRSENMNRFLRDHAGCAAGEGDEIIDWSSRDAWRQPVSEFEFVAYSMCMQQRGWPMDPDRILPRSEVTAPPAKPGGSG